MGKDVMSDNREQIDAWVREGQCREVFAQINLGKVKELLLVWTQVDDDSLQMASNSLKGDVAIELLSRAMQLLIRLKNE